MPEIDDLKRSSENMTPSEREASLRASQDDARKLVEEVERQGRVIPIPPEPIVIEIDVDVVTAARRIEEMGSLIGQATVVIEAMTALRMQMEEMLARAEAARDRRALDEDDEEA